MGIFIDILVIGLQTGAIYALVALGVALVFKATRILNFAHGEIGTSSAFLALVLMHYGLRPLFGVEDLTGLHLLIATAPAILLGAVLGLLTSVLLGWLKNATPVTLLVTTVGVALFMVGMQIYIGGAQGYRFPRYINGNAFTPPGGTIPVSWHTLIILLVLGGAAVALAAYFKTPPGVALLATSQDPYAAELQGINVGLMTGTAWAVAGALAAAAGLLGAGVFEQLTPGLMLSTFLIPSFAGALLGGINSMPGSVLGGMLLGIIVATANQLNASLQLGVPGPPQIAVLLALLAVLLFRPRGLLGTEA